MAIMIPDDCPGRASAGEKRLFRLFQDLLPDSFRVWYEPIVQGRYPDFILLADTFGLLTIEVKGWYAKEMKRVTDAEVERVVSGKGESREEKDQNPLLRAREYMFRLMDILKQQPLLRHPDGDHQGKLAFPCGFGVLFSNIKRREAEDGGWASVFPVQQVLFRDELDALESARNDRETIRRLRQMFLLDFPFEPLSEDQIRTTHGVIHKEVVVRTRPAEESSLPAGQQLPEGAVVLDVLDQKQEQLAKSVGDGHRVFFGVAGSGKTVLLVARAKLLVEQCSEKRVLVLCYNRALGSYLRSRFTEDKAFGNVEAVNFHAWARRATRVQSYPGEQSADYYQRLEAALLLQTASWSDRQRYDAILVDEGHDFEPDWFRCCVQALRQEPPGGLLIAVDGAQSLYGRPRSFTWKSVGVQAQGRTTRLSTNYRNTREILELAWQITQGTEADDEETETHVRVHPTEALRSGPVPRYRTCASEPEERIAIVSLVRSFREQGIADRDIAVLYPFAGGRRIERLNDELKQSGEVVWITGPDASLLRDRFMMRSGVRLSTIHSAKGLEFPAVILCGLDQLPRAGLPEAVKDANLLYVGLTRAMEQLVVTWAGDSTFTRAVEQSGRAVRIV